MDIIHYMVILIRQNKITDFFMILAWLWAFKRNDMTYSHVHAISITIASRITPRNPVVVQFVLHAFHRDGMTFLYKYRV